MSDELLSHEVSDELISQGSGVRCTHNKLDPDTLFTFEQWRGGRSSTTDGIPLTDLVFIRSRVGDYLCNSSHGHGSPGVDDGEVADACRGMRHQGAKFIPR